MKAEIDVDDLLRNDGYTDVLYNHQGSTLRSPASVSRSNTSNLHSRTHVTNQRGLLTFLRRILSAMKAAVLLGSTLICASIAASGFFLLSFLLLTRTLAPAAASYRKELFFDFTKADAVASAAFCPALAFGKVSDAGVRFLPPGQSMDVWLELVVPDCTGPKSADVFQVAAELAALDGRVAAAISRPCLIRYTSPFVRTVRMLWNLPWVVAGWYEERQKLRVPLFKKYGERLEVPFCVFKAMLQARAKGGELPGLYNAFVHIDLNLGLVRRILYEVRPGDVLTYILALMGLMALLGGGLTSLALLLIWGISRRPTASPDQRQAGKAAHSDEVSSEAGWSEVSSVDLDSERDREVAHSEHGHSSLDSTPVQPVITPLSAQALQRWDARSMSQHSMVSSQGDDSIPRSNHKKLR